ncbi:hypothetical protein P153DRAFT_397869 [Dothidotthia symphoricarpi CBS 119687]|uniref:Uncharacterized protein n=1 Tax=Dothidotthia symphoricarpi CBS 119687 TaxID=1392245 RepID=A0A6A6AA70_9PLEO|nr:uncharacterized protein P153DRAFT_397869 [Dothidotthia symphoricarpi CBS 119687]KAF2127984.1 hypothetical protein P153DRAFT_397869 [Dothidotthia symphoricarpi CBS 119687]
MSQPLTTTKQPRTVKGVPGVRMTHEERMSFMEQSLNLHVVSEYQNTDHARRALNRELCQLDHRSSGPFRWIKIGIHYNSNDRLTAVNNLVSRLIDCRKIKGLSSIRHDLTSASIPRQLNRQARRQQKASPVPRSIVSSAPPSGVVLKVPNSFLPSGQQPPAPKRRAGGYNNNIDKNVHGTIVLPANDVRCLVAPSNVPIPDGPKDKSTRQPSHIPLVKVVAATGMAVDRAERVKAINLAWPAIGTRGVVLWHAYGCIRYNKSTDTVQLQSLLSSLTGVDKNQYCSEKWYPADYTREKNDLLQSLAEDEQRTIGQRVYVSLDRAIAWGVPRGIAASLQYMRDVCNTSSKEYRILAHGHLADGKELKLSHRYDKLSGIL